MQALRWIGVVGFLASWLFAVFAVSGALLDLKSPKPAPSQATHAHLQDEVAEEPLAAISSLALSCLANAAVLAYVASRSSGSLFSLTAALFTLQFGAETALTQLETWFLRSAFDVSNATIIRIVLAGAIRAALFAPVAVLVAKRFLKPSDSTNLVAHQHWNRAMVGCALFITACFYVLLYFAFGYFIAWRSPEVRVFYQGNDQLLSFLEQMRLVQRDTPFMLPFQLLRGLLWCGLACLVSAIFATRGRRHIAAATALVMGILPASLLLLPNPLMPPPVRHAHLVEMVASMFVFGACAGWTFASCRTVTFASKPPEAMAQPTREWPTGSDPRRSESRGQP